MTIDIATFSDFSAHLRDHLDQRKATGRPLCITTNGTAEAVVLSPAAYDELVERAEMVRSLDALDESMNDLEAGRVSPAKEAIRQIAIELNLPFDR